MSNDLESEWMEVCDERDKLRSRLQIAEKALEDLRDRAANPQAGYFDAYLVIDWCNSALATIRGTDHG